MAIVVDASGAGGTADGTDGNGVGSGGTSAAADSVDECNANAAGVGDYAANDDADDSVFLFFTSPGSGLGPVSRKPASNQEQGTDHPKNEWTSPKTPSSQPQKAVKLRQPALPVPSSPASPHFRPVRLHP